MISKKEIEHIAKLARLELSEKEKDKYSKELNGILDYVKKLNEVDTKDIKPTAQVTGLTNVFREDESLHEVDPVRGRGALRALAASNGVNIEKIKKIIGQVPEREGNFVKTKPVLEK